MSGLSWFCVIFFIFTAIYFLIAIVFIIIDTIKARKKGNTGNDGDDVFFVLLLVLVAICFFAIVGTFLSNHEEKTEKIVEVYDTKGELIEKNVRSD